MAVTTTTTLRRSVRGVAPTAPAAAVTVPGGAAPAVAAAATDRTSSWCNTIAGSRPTLMTFYIIVQALKLGSDASSMKEDLPSLT